MAMKSVLPLAALVALVGCGSSNGSAPDVAAFDQLASSALTTLDRYRTATASIATEAACNDAVAAYGPAMTGDLNRMQAMAAGMDSQMRNLGQASGADIQCGMGVMEDELHRHLGIACSSVDMATNRAEAAQHGAAMDLGLEHMRMRSAEMSEMMGSSGEMMGSGMGPKMIDGGWPLPDGGMMGWDDHIPGCWTADAGIAGPDHVMR